MPAPTRGAKLLVSVFGMRAERAANRFENLIDAVLLQIRLVHDPVHVIPQAKIQGEPRAQPPVIIDVARRMFERRSCASSGARSA